MRRTTFLLLAAFVSLPALLPAQTPMDLDQLVNRRGVYLHPQTLEPFSGSVVRHEEGAVRERGTIQNGRWHGARETFYLDGQLVGSNGYTGGLLGNAEPIVIGANQWGSAAKTANTLEDPFDGTIGKVFLYDQALSASDVAKLAAGEFTNRAPDAVDDSVVTRPSAASASRPIRSGSPTTRIVMSSGRRFSAKTRRTSAGSTRWIPLR